MQIVQASTQDRDQIVGLLESNQLPAADLPAALDDFYAVLESGLLVGLIGMERYTDYGLLRSMVVHPGYRNRQIAENLVQHLEASAGASGVKSMYLLTETADRYFSRKGYRVIPRDLVPAEVKKSSEFSHVCPASAVVMQKDLM